MIETAQRMHEAGNKSTRAANADMGDRGSRSEAKREDCKLEKTLHGKSPTLDCKLCSQLSKHLQ